MSPTTTAHCSARRRRGVSAILALALLPLAACGGPSPVARLTAEPGSLSLGYPETAELRLAWEPLEPLSPAARPMVFVHLVDGRGEVVRTFDHPFPDGWRPGEPVDYALTLYQSALTAPLPPGPYRLTLGLFDLGGERWSLESACPGTGRQEYEVARVEVLSPAEGGPRFDFTGEWGPVQLGSDRQVPARRWLRGNGEVVVEDPPAAGGLRLMLVVPEAADASTRLVLDEGAAAQRVELTTDCGSWASSLSGAGVHQVDVELDPAAGPGGSCRVRLRPNFHLLLEDGLERRALSLDVVAWQPAGR